MPNYIIPNVLHFVWFGKEISQCKETLIAWRNLHSEHVINLWTSADILAPSCLIDIKKICIQYKIKLRDIRQEANLDLHALILQEVNKERYWSASDIARFSILKEEPGFYFDVGILPKKPLPKKISCTKGFLLIVDIPESVAYEEASISYKIFCAAYRKHHFFEKIISLIKANFEYLQVNPMVEEKFYQAFNTKQHINPELTIKQQANYVFARITTGSVAQTVLFQDYIYNIEDDILDINLKFFDISFYYQILLDIPVAKKFDSDNLLFNPLKNGIILQILLNTAKTVNCPLADKMNSSSTLRFFSLQEFDGPIHLLARLTKNKQLEETKKLKSEIGGVYIGLRKSKFFMLPNIHLPEKTAKIKTFINTSSYSLDKV